MTAPEALRIHVPPLPVHLRAIRTFLASAGRQMGCSDEAIEDLRLAATEICTQAIEEGSAPDGIEVRVWWDERLVIEFEPAPGFAGPDDGGDEAAERMTGGRRLALVTALFPDVAVDAVGPTAVVRFRVDADGLPT